MERREFKREAVKLIKERGVCTGGRRSLCPTRPRDWDVFGSFFCSLTL
jgi:hypothetical protein